MRSDAGFSVDAKKSRPRRSLLHHRDFRLLWAGQSVSLVGSAVSFVALPLVALVVLHVDAFQMGVLTAVERLPPLLVGPLAGPLVDRGSRLGLMIVADVGRALLLAWIPVGALLGVLVFWHLVVVAFGVGALTLLFNVAYPAFMPNVIPPERLAEGNSKLGASQSAAEVAGPGLASLLMAVGPTAGVLADAVSYVVSCWCLLRLRTREAARPVLVKAEPRHRLAGLFDDVKSGFPLLWRDQVLRAVTLSNATLAFFAQLQAAVYFIFLVQTLHLGPGLIGMLFLVAGGIGFLTAAWYDRLAERIGIGALLVTGQVILVAGGALLAAASGPSVMASALIVAGEACFGAGLSLFGIGFTTLSQLRTTDEVRGRVIGTSKFLTSASVPIAAVLGGVLGVVFTVRVVMVIGALGMAIGLVVVLRRPVLGAPGKDGTVVAEDQGHKAGVAGIPRVFASGARVATVDGTDIHLLTVESWNDRVAVRLVGATTEYTRQLIAMHEAATHEWAAMHEWAGRRRAGHDNRPPASPAEVLFDSLSLRLDDGMGTDFRATTSSVGGTGTELLGEWFFRTRCSGNG